MLLYICIYLGIISLITLICFLADKRRALQKQWRIRERTLLLLCVLGGCFGGLLGMFSAHHKTNTVKFMLTVPLLCAVYTGLLFYLSLYFGKAGLFL